MLANHKIVDLSNFQYKDIRRRYRGAKKLNGHLIAMSDNELPLNDNSVAVNGNQLQLIAIEWKLNGYSLPLIAIETQVMKM